MNHPPGTIRSLFAAFVFRPLRALRALGEVPAYRRDFRSLEGQKPSAATAFPLGRAYPCLGDRSSASGTARGHYFHQDLLVARRIHAGKSLRHIDVGSRLDGFVAHVAAFREIEVIDIRTPPRAIPNVTFRQADMMAPLPESLVACCDSLSCLHALEHFGLGRYGDPVDYDGYLRGLDSLSDMLRQDGTLYLSVPIGPQRIEFNAHRVFSVSYLLKCLEGKYHLDRFSYVDDSGDLHEDVQITDDHAAGSFGCTYGCGIFELTKV